MKYWPHLYAPQLPPETPPGASGGMPHPVQPTSPDLGEGGSDSGQLTPTGGGGTAASAAAAAAAAAAATAASLADYNQSTSKGHEILSQVRKDSWITLDRHKHFGGRISWVHFLRRSMCCGLKKPRFSKTNYCGDQPLLFYKRYTYKKFLLQYM